MNPLTQTRNQMKLNERELEMGVAGTKNSWHQEFKDSAWVFMGGLPYQLTEGDVICMFSQYGEVVHINLIRDHTSGKSKGFGFLCYEDQRSTILAVDNLNGYKLLSRMIRVDHIHQYKLPKDLEKLDQDKKKLFMEGVAPTFMSESESSSEEEEEEVMEKHEKKKKKKEKKKSKKKKKKKDKSVKDKESETDKPTIKQTNGQSAPDDRHQRHAINSRDRRDKDSPDADRRHRRQSPEDKGNERRRRRYSRSRSRSRDGGQRHDRRHRSRSRDQRRRDR